MKKMLIAILATLALMSCQETVPTCSPTEAVIYVGDTLQLSVIGEANPSWEVRHVADSTGMVGGVHGRVILEVIAANRVIGVDTGTTEVSFHWYPKYHINGCGGRPIGCTVTVLPNAEKKSITGVLCLVDAPCTTQPCIHDWANPNICVEPMVYWAIVNDKGVYFIENPLDSKMDSNGVTTLTILDKQFTTYKDKIRAYGEVTAHLSVHRKKYYRINAETIEQVK